MHFKKKQTVSNQTLLFFYYCIKYINNPRYQKSQRGQNIIQVNSSKYFLRLFAWWVEQTNDGYYLYMQLEYCSFPGYKYQPADLLTFLIIIQIWSRIHPFREEKLSTMTDQRLPQEELNSITSQNTITTGACGYQTDNYVKNSHIRMADEFYDIGINFITPCNCFPGEPKNRNHYAKTFVMANHSEDVLALFDTWGQYVCQKQKYQFFIHQPKKQI